MATLFLLCAGLGAAVLVLQIVLGLLGLDHGDHGDASLGEGVELLSVRALSAGVAFFGLGGLAALGLGLPVALAAGLALLPGGAALVGTALLMRQVLRLESDGTPRIEGAVGSMATVYLTVPAESRAPGRVLLALQGRTVELRAVTHEERAIPTGASVIVVGVLDGETVEVVPNPSIGEILDDSTR